MKSFGDQITDIIEKRRASDKKTSRATVARAIGKSETNFWHQLKSNNFRESDMIQIANALDCDLKLELIERAPATPTPAPVPQSPPPYYVDYTKEQVNQWKRYIGTDSAPMPPDSPGFKLFKQFLDDVANKRTITFKEG